MHHGQCDADVPSNLPLRLPLISDNIRHSSNNTNVRGPMHTLHFLFAIGIMESIHPVLIFAPPGFQGPSEM